MERASSRASQCSPRLLMDTYGTSRVKNHGLTATVKTRANAAGGP